MRNKISQYAPNPLGGAPLETFSFFEIPELLSAKRKRGKGLSMLKHKKDLDLVLEFLGRI